MGWYIYQLLLVLWALAHTWNSKVIAGVVSSSNRPTAESPRLTAGKGTHLGQISAGGFQPSTESERVLRPTTALPTRGQGSTPPLPPSTHFLQQPATQSAPEEQLTEVPTKFPTVLKMADSAGRMRRSTGASQGRVTTPHSWGGQSLLTNSSPPYKAEVHHKSTQSRLAQSALGEVNGTSLTPPPPKHTTSSPLAVLLTTAKLSLTTAPATATALTTVPRQQVPSTAKPATTRHPGDPTSNIAFSSSTKRTAKTGTNSMLTTTNHISILSTTNRIPPTPSPTMNTKPKQTSTITMTPSTALPTTPRAASSPAAITTRIIKETSKPLVPIKPDPGEGNNSSGGSRAGSVVAGLVGGALVLMLGGIAFIMWRKRHFHQRQINDGTWAGPSPFLDGSAAAGSQPRLMGDEGTEDRRQDSKRISLMGFFPRGLSRRLSHLKEVDEQVLMADVTIGSTFGRGQEAELSSTNGISPDQNQEENKDKEQNEKQIQTQEDTANTFVPPPAVELSVPIPAQSEDISQDPAPSEAQATPPAPQLDENHQAPLPILPSLVLQEVDLGPPVSEVDIAPPPPSEMSFVPPPPPPLPSST